MESKELKPNSIEEDKQQNTNIVVDVVKRGK